VRPGGRLCVARKTSADRYCAGTTAVPPQEVPRQQRRPEKPRSQRGQAHQVKGLPSVTPTRHRHPQRATKLDWHLLSARIWRMVMPHISGEPVNRYYARPGRREGEQFFSEARRSNLIHPPRSRQLE